MLLGPPCTDTGEPGAFANHDCVDACCDALEGVLPEGQEKKINDAAINSVNCAIRLTVAAILTKGLNGILLRSILRRFGVTVSSLKILTASKSRHMLAAS